MTHWHEKTFAKIGLRLAGLALLLSAGAEATLLNSLVHQNAGQDADPTAFLLAALLCASASAGAALACLGAGLWEPVALSARWTSNPPKADPATRRPEQ
ncbi:hypothetical protein [Sphingobium sp. KCTC 72723]|uniref:hypothetical protein n=1 Tax=Sphingobium sp. KCTC 72723 TaxID=2733867 RepID=UPI00165DA0AC|nr:hypothetical protein [Sphingobium sp. KCTC 72723]